MKARKNRLAAVFSRDVINYAFEPFFIMPMTAVTTAPATPPPTRLPTIPSRPGMEISIGKMPPPTAPAIELPTVPRDFSGIAFAIPLPPTAPAMA